MEPAPGHDENPGGGFLLPQRRRLQIYLGLRALARRGTRKVRRSIGSIREKAWAGLDAIFRLGHWKAHQEANDCRSLDRSRIQGEEMANRTALVPVHFG